MAIRIWDPLELDWTDRMRRWLDVDSEAGRVIRVEEIHDEGMMVVRAEMPGIDPDKDVEISVSDGMLHVLATRHEHTEGREKGTFHSEFRYGEFSRDMVLPSGVDHTAIFPDDIIVADDDGAVVIPAALADFVASEGAEHELMETWLVQEVEKGAKLPGLYPPNEENKKRYEEWKKKR